MPDYKKMYSTLFNAVTDSIRILQSGQQKTEELYVSSDEPIITVLEKSDTDNIKGE